MKSYLPLLFIVSFLLLPGVVVAQNPIGTITPPSSIPTVTGDPSSFVAGLIRTGVSLLLIVSFLAFFIWTIIAGLRFVFSGGDSKAVGSAWAQIYWGLIGMAIVLGSYAIVVLVETIFNVDIFTNFSLPTTNP